MHLLSDYRYDLPEERIAQHPAENREESKLLRLDKKRAIMSHHRFKDIENLLMPDDLVVINNTRVIPARLRGYKESGGKVEVMIIDYVGGMAMQKEMGYFECDCMIRASKSPKPGTLLKLGAGENANLNAVVQCVKGAIFTVRFLFKGDSDNFEDRADNFESILENSGEIPLPPYIQRDGDVKNRGGYCKNIGQMESPQRREDKERYQTVYATEKGAVAAPTAGLHFTDSLMQSLMRKGIEFVNITLHVGYGTFVPVRVDDIRDHQIHSEFFSIPEASSDAVNRAKSEGRRVIAVGTTSVRTLEYATDDKGELHSGNGMCNLFIYPGYRFKIVDAIITNFHLPESTLIMLVSAFSGRDLILSAYSEAIEKKYRFFSYGDAMFLE